MGRGGLPDLDVRSGGQALLSAALRPRRVSRRELQDDIVAV